MKCIKCPISKICSQDYSVNCRYSLKMYQQGRADRNKEFQKQFDMMYADKLEKVRADERAKVLREVEEALDSNGYGHDGNLGDIIDKLKL